MKDDDRMQCRQPLADTNPPSHIMTATYPYLANIIDIVNFVYYCRRTIVRRQYIKWVEANNVSVGAA